MSRNEYLAELKSYLNNLSDDECEAAIKYYEEFFQDAGEENEQYVIAELGSPKKLAESLIGEGNFSEKTKRKYIPQNENVTRRQSNTALTVVLIILAVIFSPAIIGIASGILGIVIGAAALFFSLVVVLGIVSLALAVVGAATLIYGLVKLFMIPMEGLALVGSGLIIFSIGLAMLMLFVLLCGKLIPAITRGTVNIFRRLLGRKTVAA